MELLIRARKTLNLTSTRSWSEHGDPKCRLLMIQFSSSDNILWFWVLVDLQSVAVRERASMSKRGQAAAEWNISQIPLSQPATFESLFGS